MLLTKPRLQVFLCHASQDKSAILQLYNALKLEDWIDPWLDKMKILPGQDWRTAIESAVDASDAVIICLSNRSVEKEGYLQKELKYAYDVALEKPEETIFLIPLRLDECTPPRSLRALQWIDYFGPDKDENHTSLLEALRVRYEQRLPSKIEELAQKQREERKRLEFQELKRQEQEKVRRMIEEQQRREAEEQARLEAEILARQEIEKGISLSSDYAESPDTHDQVNQSTQEDKNLPMIAVVSAIVLLCLCCITIAVFQLLMNSLQQ